MGFVNHLAILHKGPLEKIFSGEKTIESRFTKNRCLPFGRISEGDTILLKESSGPIRGKTRVLRVLSFSDLTPKKVEELFNQYPGIKAGPNFVQRKTESKFATLMFLSEAEQFNSPLQIKKTDRRAWVILDSPTQQSLGLSSLP